MFEYLMPNLVMPTWPGSLLDEMSQSAVMRQIHWGKERGVPWGVSESGYHAFDVQHNYQYQAFGVPGLGLRRGLADDMVVAPYATLLALMVSPQRACENLFRMQKMVHAENTVFMKRWTIPPHVLQPVSSMRWYSLGWRITRVWHFRRWLMYCLTLP